jgi:hypothetical protein
MIPIVVAAETTAVMMWLFMVAPLSVALMD